MRATLVCLSLLLVMAFSACTLPSTDRAPAVAVHPSTEADSSVQLYGVGFQYDPYLAAGVQARVVEAFTDEAAMGYTRLPQHLSLAFSGGYADEDPIYHRQQLNLETWPQLVVYPASDYAALMDVAAQQIALLQTLLAERPAVPGGTLPYLPLVNAAQVFHSQVAYLDFANGSGIRYLTHYAQGVSPVTNRDLIYTFQGLTGDNAYYVAAFFPVTTAAFPDTVEVDDWDAFSANLSSYLAEATAILDGLTVADFTPNLALLDAVVISLQVEPTVMPRTSAEAGGEPALLPSVAPPIGLVYRLDSSLYRIDVEGRTQLLTDRSERALPAPDAAHAVYMDDDRRLWLIDLADGGERELAAGVDLSWLYQWGNARTLVLGVWLAPEEREGVATGHVATLDIDTGELRIVDEEYLSLGRPALAADGQALAYDTSPFYADVTLTGRVYRPDGDPQAIDPALFDGLDGDSTGHLYNPAWTPDGRKMAWLWGAAEGSRLVVFDLARQRAIAVHAWQPAQSGALPPSPQWSPDGRWLAIEVWANHEQESGVWVLPADGTLARLHVPAGREPVWLNPSQLMYTALDENMHSRVLVFDLDMGRNVAELDLPAGSTILPASSPPKTGPATGE
jgi:Tol biopolymer transport system component